MRRHVKTIASVPPRRAKCLTGIGGLDAITGEVPAAVAAPPAEWELRLYVAGQSPRSLAAFANLKRLCETHLAGNYRIEVIDLLRTPQLSRDDQIVVIPTLVRRLPLPTRKIIGDLSDAARTLVALDLTPEAPTVTAPSEDTTDVAQR
jgi:circadian clock protein KaiB